MFLKGKGKEATKGICLHIILIYQEQVCSRLTSATTETVPHGSQFLDRLNGRPVPIEDGILKAKVGYTVAILPGYLHFSNYILKRNTQAF